MRKGGGVGGGKKPFVSGSQHKEYTQQKNLTPADALECSTWRARRNWNMKLQNISSWHLIATVRNSLLKGFHRDGQEQQGWWSTPLCTDIHWSLFSFMGGQTIFIWCPLKYTSSVSINLNLQRSAVRHYATAALSPTARPKRGTLSFTFPVTLLVIDSLSLSWQSIFCRTIGQGLPLPAPPTQPPTLVDVRHRWPKCRRGLCCLTFTKSGRIIV